MVHTSMPSSFSVRLILSLPMPDPWPKGNPPLNFCDLCEAIGSLRLRNPSMILFFTELPFGLSCHRDPKRPPLPAQSVSIDTGPDSLFVAAIIEIFLPTVGSFRQKNRKIVPTVGRQFSPIRAIMFPCLSDRQSNDPPRHSLSSPVRESAQACCAISCPQAVRRATAGLSSTALL